MYAGDHPPPHFHVEGRSFRAVVAIDGFAVLKGNVRRAADAMDWARNNPELLRAEWARLNREG